MHNRDNFKSSLTTLSHPLAHHWTDGSLMVGKTNFHSWGIENPRARLLTIVRVEGQLWLVCIANTDEKIGVRCGNRLASFIPEGHYIDTESIEQTTELQMSCEVKWRLHGKFKKLHPTVECDSWVVQFFSNVQHVWTLTDPQLPQIKSESIYFFRKTVCRILHARTTFEQENNWGK